ncbi:MAG: lysophospholipid acyltransferase family protein [Bacteroidota bacterium]
MNTIISLLVLVAIVGSVPVAFWPVAILWLMAIPFGKGDVLMHKILEGWARYFLWVCPYWHFRMIGAPVKEKNRPYVIVSNHQSMLDIIVIYRLSMQFRWVSKVENFRIPLFGWLMEMAGYIKLKRNNSKSILKMYNESAKVLSEQKSILIFPEGTRSRDGQLQKFKDGAFRLAHDMKAPILPVVIEGTHGAIPDKGIRLAKNKRFTMKVLEPVGYDEFKNKSVDETVKMIRELILSELTRVREKKHD